MKYILLFLGALSFSAHAAKDHPDGSVTLTKEEKEAIVEFVQKLNLIIEIQQRKLQEGSKPGKCV
jgi:hypothetical protein